MRAVDENLVAIVKDNDLSMMRTEDLPERLLLTCFWKLFPAMFHLRVLNCGCRKVPCRGGCWGCRLKSVRVCAWNLNARNRYKSDRDCERRRADVQRPFAMPGIEGCTTCLLEACWAASSFVFVFLKIKRKLNGNSQFQWQTWIPGSWQHWVKRGQKWPVNMNYGFGWLSFYGERHLSVVIWKKQ